MKESLRRFRLPFLEVGTCTGLRDDVMGCVLGKVHFAFKVVASLGFDA